MWRLLRGRTIGESVWERIGGGGREKVGGRQGEGVSLVPRVGREWRVGLLMGRGGGLCCMSNLSVNVP